MKKISSFTFIAVLFLSSISFAKESLYINKITIKGLKQVSSAMVLNCISIKPQQVFGTADINDSVHQLYRTGYFANVNLFVDNEVLIAQLEEHPSIAKIKIVGVKNSNKILDLMKAEGLKIGHMLAMANVHKAEKALEAHYLAKGNYDVKIKFDVSKPLQGVQNITITIDEGQVASISRINIIGNHHFSSKELCKHFHSSVKTLFSWWTHNDQFSREKFAADLEALRSFYYDQGYIEIQILNHQISMSPDKEKVYLTISIDEGKQYNFGKISLSGNQQFVAEIHEKIKGPKSGQIFSRKAMLTYKESLEELLGSHGYSQAVVEPITNIASSSKAVDLDFYLDLKTRMVVRKINFIGHKTTKDEVLRRECPQFEGNWISTTKVQATKDNLISKGMAKVVDSSLLPTDSGSNYVDLNYNIEEAKVNEFSVSLSYDRQNGPNFHTGLNQKNFFGSGNNIEIGYDISKAVKEYNLSVFNPYFTRSGIGFGFNSSYYKTTLGKTSNVLDFQSNSLVNQLNWVFPISTKEAIGVSFGVKNTSLHAFGANEVPEFNAFIDHYGKHVREYFNETNYNYNTLDKMIFPTKGTKQKLNFRINAPSSTVPQYIASYNYEVYRALSDQYIFNAKAAASYGASYGKGYTYPFFNNFYAGGEGSVRGYAENNLGPKTSTGKSIGGNALISGSLSLIVPVPGKKQIDTLRPSIFVDCGQVYNTFKSHVNSGLRYSVGMSIIWQSPFGAPLTLSASYPINKKLGDKSRALAFNFGTNF